MARKKADDSHNLVTDDFLERAWSENAAVIRQFLDNRPQYEQLCNELVYILRKRLEDKGIEYATITSRAKTLNSFLEKALGDRKSYEDPFRQITDFAGVRVVFLYTSDRPDIEKLIEAEFDVIERVDKIEEQDPDRFGYGALHYLVRLHEKSAGARYDDLKGLVCEIQVRTVLQDAWAIIDHHLNYKQKADVPKPLRRKLYALAGQFETADDQFDHVRAERRTYIEEVQEKHSDKNEFLKQELNLDTLTEYLKWRFPGWEVSTYPAQIATVFEKATRVRYKTLDDLEQAVRRTEKANEAFAKVLGGDPSAAGLVRRSLSFAHPELRGDDLREFYAMYEHLVEPEDGHQESGSTNNTGSNGQQAG